MNHPIIRATTNILLTALLTLCFFLRPTPINASADVVDKITYAYLPADTILYRAEKSSFTPFVTLPKTYFVAVLNNNNDDYISVSYLDIVGFALKSTIELCDYEPVTKYATLTATPNNDGLGVNLRDIPNHQKGKVLLTIPPDAKLTLYGDMYGTALIPAVGDSWCYVKYTSDAVSIFGYVYSSQVTADLPTNNTIEKMPIYNGEDTAVIPSPPKFTTTMQIVFIVALSAPAIIIMLIIFKRKTPQKQSRKPRHSDTF